MWKIQKLLHEFQINFTKKKIEFTILGEKYKFNCFNEWLKITGKL